MSKIDPSNFIGPEVFKVRELLCSSHSGKGTGMACSECVRDVADERDRLKAENRILRKDESSIVGWYWATSDYIDEGWCGSFNTLQEARDHAAECLDEGDTLDDMVSFINVQQVKQTAADAA